MNRLVKKVLKATGIAALIRVFKSPGDKLKFEEQFGGIETHKVKVGSEEVIFSTLDKYSKHWFFPRYYPNKQHEPSATELFVKHVKPTDTVLDIGAHLGYFTCVSAALAFKGQVHCFEMDEQCFPLIDKNISLNRFENTVVNNCGVGQKSGHEKIPLLDSPNPGLSMNGKAETHHTVEFVSIDEYAEKNEVEPDFIKIDVEGAELQVLLGMTAVLRSPKVKLLVEIHPWHLKKLFSTHYSEVLKLIELAGFRIFHLPEHRTDSGELTEIDSNTKITTNDMLFCYKN